MKEYQVLLKVRILKEWANLEDFLEELNAFNKSNEGIIEVKVLEKNHLE